MTDLEPTRRNLLTGLAAAGVAVPLLAACGSGGSGDENAATGTVPSSGTSPNAGGSPAGGSGGGGGGINTAEIPVGGGKIFANQQIVVTQPTAGQFKAFSAICTHAGCPVTSISGGTIDCPCHGSQFSITDGSVKGGPAPTGLPEKKVTVTGNTLKVT
ncbi:MAG TPA: Rieske (2Fe-2S) protein [Marmoricola sp.]|nr:Rieske (2Fe-2S) protein [Marmoricola sp.]